MKFLKDYWWAFALVIGAILIYVFMFREDETTTTPKCATTATLWNTKVAETKAAILGDSAWLALINNDVGTGAKFATEAEAVQANAEWHVKTTMAICKPAGV